MKEGLADFEEFLAEGFARSPTRTGVPDEVIAAIVAGIQMVIHDHLRCGAITELPKLAAQLSDWALGYETPPQPLPDGSMMATASQPGGDIPGEDVPERDRASGRRRLRTRWRYAADRRCDRIAGADLAQHPL